MAVPLLDKKIMVKKFKRPQSDRFVSVKDIVRKLLNNISTSKRKEIVVRAAQLDVVVTNKLALFGRRRMGKSLIGRALCSKLGFIC